MSSRVDAGVGGCRPGQLADLLGERRRGERPHPMIGPGRDRAGQVGDRQPDPGRADVDCHRPTGVRADLIEPWRPADLADPVADLADQTDAFQAAER